MYYRDLPADLARAVVGEFSLPWSGRVAQVQGRKVVAISLGTTDRREAERRRDQVHVEVEILVDKAIREVRMVGQTTSRMRLVSRLTADQHRRIADWVYAMTLRAQDLEIVEDPAEIYDDTRVIAWLGRVQAEEASQGSETEALARLMERRGWDDDDPSDRSRPSALEEVLEDIGIRMVDPEQLRLAGLTVLRARRRAWDALMRRERGEAIETPPVTFSSPLVDEEEKREQSLFPDVDGPRLRETFAEFLIARGMKKNTADDYRNQMERFVDLFGNLPVKAVTRRMVLDFALTLAKFPSRYPAGWRGKRVREIVALSEKRPDLPLLAPQSINDRSVGALRSFFSWCIRRQLVESNPASNVVLDIPKSSQKPRRPYRLEHLQLIFSQDVFTRGARPHRGAGEAMYWIPLIALYSGARLEEIGQLHLSDIRQVDGVWVFDINDDGDGEKTLKTRASRRMIPIHRELITRGLLQERSRLIAAGETRMFPLLRRNRNGKLTAMFSKWWGIWSRDIGIDDPQLVFHSFRHSAKDKYRATKIPVDVQDALLGHTGTTVGSMYGDGHDVHTLNEYVQRIDWSAVFSADQPAEARAEPP